MTNQNEPDMLLPEGLTCAECWLFKRCSGFGVTQANNTLCDFSPSKFMFDTDKYISLRSTIAALKEDAERLFEQYINPCVDYETVCEMENKHRSLMQKLESEGM